jgi:hypothetical protein
MPSSLPPPTVDADPEDVNFDDVTSLLWDSGTRTWRFLHRDRPSSWQTCDNKGEGGVVRMCAAISKQLECGGRTGSDWIKRWVGQAFVNPSRGVHKPPGSRTTMTAARAAGWFSSAALATCTLPPGADCFLGAIANAMGAAAGVDWLLALQGAHTDRIEIQTPLFLKGGAKLPFTIQRFKHTIDATSSTASRSATSSPALKLRDVVGRVHDAAAEGTDLRVVVEVGIGHVVAFVSMGAGLSGAAALDCDPQHKQALHFGCDADETLHRLRAWGVVEATAVRRVVPVAPTSRNRKRKAVGGSSTELQKAG